MDLIWRLQMKLLKGLFQTVAFISAGAFTLAFFNIGRVFFDANLRWFVSSLWIALIGEWMINKMEKKQAKAS